MPEALHVSTLMLYEFRQSVRFQVWLHAQEKNKGYSQFECNRALVDLETDLETGAVVVVSVEWPDVHRIAQTLSKNYTLSSGYRAFDILHVATALHLRARQFLTFDARQRKLATAEKLKVLPS